MHEPALAWLAFLGATIGTWVYRRYFEHLMAPDEDFERWCAGGPLLVALRCSPGAARLAEALGRVLAGEWVNIHGARPWPYYKLRLSITVSGDVVRVTIAGARRRRGAEPPRDLLGGLAAALREHGEAEVWATPEAVHDPLAAAPGPGGWAAAASAGGFDFEPRSAPPSWLL